MSATNETRVIHIFLPMSYGRLDGEPQLFEDFEEANEAFEEHTGISWGDLESRCEETGVDLDTMLRAPSVGTRILFLELSCPSSRSEAA